MSVAENIANIRARIAGAAQRAGRDPDSVTLMAVTKTFPASAIRNAYEAGLRVFGENRVQEFAGKFDAVRDLSDAEFHLIGHLQSNKAGKATELFHAIDSVDSLKLAQRLNDAAAKLGKTLDVLIEVNVGGEAAKSGVAPDLADHHGSQPTSELGKILFSAERLPALRIRGLMTVPPFTDDPEGARPYFRRLRELCDQIAARDIAAVRMDVLSMGMSHDFEVAIEEGSTCVRLGTAIFGARAKI